jgi:hypothetical protein
MSEKHLHHVTELHQENLRWIEDIEAYRADINQLQNLLGEAVQKNNAQELLQKAEQFQNRFILELEQLDETKHVIKLHEHFLTEKVKEHPEQFEHLSGKDHADLRSKMEYLETHLPALRREFNEFLTTSL